METKEDLVEKVSGRCGLEVEGKSERTLRTGKVRYRLAGRYGPVISYFYS